MQKSRYSRVARPWVLVVALLFAACGSDSTGPVADPGVAPLVGDWTATRLVLTSVANPSVAPDLVALGAQFHLNIQPSGQYTAILVFAQQTSTEIGTLVVSGNTLIMERDFPAPGRTSATFALSGNQLTMDGESEFDFNLDGTAEPAQAHFEMIRK